jgi:hypothetical protein
MFKLMYQEQSEDKLAFLAVALFVCSSFQSRYTRAATPSGVMKNRTLRHSRKEFECGVRKTESGRAPVAQKRRLRA